MLRFHLMMCTGPERHWVPLWNQRGMMACATLTASLVGSQTETVVQPRHGLCFGTPASGAVVLAVASSCLPYDYAFGRNGWYCNYNQRTNDWVEYSTTGNNCMPLCILDCGITQWWCQYPLCGFCYRLRPIAVSQWATDRAQRLPLVGVFIAPINSLRKAHSPWDLRTIEI